MEQLKNKLVEAQNRLDKILAGVNRGQLQTEIVDLKNQTLEEGFWNDPQKAQKITKQLSDKQKLLAELSSLEQKINDAIQVSSDEIMQEEIKKSLVQIEKTLDDLELKLFLSGPHDDSEAIVTIHSGAGGVEAMDWAGMLFRMYQKYFEKKG